MRNGNASMEARAQRSTSITQQSIGSPRKGKRTTSTCGETTANGRETYPHIVSSLQEGQRRHKEQPYNDDSIDQHRNHRPDIVEVVKRKDQRVDELIPCGED